MRFPFASQNVIPEAPPAELSIEAPHETLRGIQVLVVDDDRDAREFVQVCLQRTGARVHVAGSAADAATHLKSSIDILITDIAMPGQDGYSLLEQARATRPALPAIAFTAYARPEDEQKVTAAGFNFHLTKPAEAAGLIEAVSALVQRRDR